MLFKVVSGSNPQFTPIMSAPVKRAREIIYNVRPFLSTTTMFLLLFFSCLMIKIYFPFISYRFHLFPRHALSCRPASLSMTAHFCSGTSLKSPDGPARRVSATGSPPPYFFMHSTAITASCSEMYRVVLKSVQGDSLKVAVNFSLIW